MAGALGVSLLLIGLGVLLLLGPGRLVPVYHRKHCGPLSSRRASEGAGLCHAPPPCGPRPTRDGRSRRPRARPGVTGAPGAGP